MDNMDSLESILHQVHDEGQSSADRDHLRDHFEQTRIDFLRELETAVVAVNETSTEVYEKALEIIVRKYFDALLTFQQQELKDVVLEKAKRWDETTQTVLTKLIEQYG